MGFTKIRNSKLPDRVAEALYTEITKGTFKAGEKLPTEAEMSEQMGVARPTIREAVSRLIGLGLIERGDYGVFVADSAKPVVRSALVPILLAEWEIRELYEARILVECDLVSLACQKVTDEDITELTRINELLTDPTMTSSDYFKNDMEFHTYLAKMSGNAIMQSISKILNDMFNRYEKMVRELHSVHASTYDDHKELIEAIRTGNVEVAHEIVVRTLSSSEHGIYELKERRFKD